MNNIFIINDFETIYNKYFNNINILFKPIRYNYKLNNIKYIIYIFTSRLPFYNLLVLSLYKDDYPFGIYKYTYIKDNTLTSNIYKYFIYKLYYKSYLDNKKESE